MKNGNKRQKTLFSMRIAYTALAIFSTSFCHGADLRKVTNEPGSSQYDAAINQNFDSIENELSNAVHITSTETIVGYKYFTNPVDFGTITADVGTITTLNSTTLSATTVTATAVVATTITLNGLLYAGNPVGAILMYISSNVTPSGWLYCDGSSKSTTTYSRLFAIIGYTYGGSGANFSLPDFRGVFPKGQGTTNRAAGVDANGNFYAATIGAYTQDKAQGHYHNVVHYGSTQATLPTTNNGVSGNASVMHGSGSDDAQAISVVGPRTDGTNGTPRTGLTTEPQSIGINFIIYAGI